MSCFGGLNRPSRTPATLAFGDSMIRRDNLTDTTQFTNWWKKTHTSPFIRRSTTWSSGPISRFTFENLCGATRLDTEPEWTRNRLRIGPTYLHALFGNSDRKTSSFRMQGVTPKERRPQSTPKDLHPAPHHRRSSSATDLQPHNRIP